MSESNILWYLEKFDLFQKLDMSSISNLAKKSSMLKYKKNDLIFLPEDSKDKIFFLKKGRVKISIFNKQGEEFIKAIIKPGEMFGKLPYVPGSEPSDIAFAIQDTTLCLMTSEEFEELVENDSGLKTEVMKFIGYRLQKLERRVELLSFRDSKQRLIEMMLDFKEDFGKRVGDEFFIDQTLSHREIAALIATSRQTVTKLLNELREKEYIDFNRKKLIIRNLEGLQSELKHNSV